MRPFQPVLSGSFSDDEFRWALAPDRGAPGDLDAAPSVNAADPRVEEGATARRLGEMLASPGAAYAASLRAGDSLLAPGGETPKAMASLSPRERAACFDVRSGLLGAGAVRVALSAVIAVAGLVATSATALMRLRHHAMQLVVAAGALAFTTYAVFGPRAPSYEILPDPEATPRPAVTAPDASAVAQLPHLSMPRTGVQP